MSSVKPTISLLLLIFLCIHGSIQAQPDDIYSRYDVYRNPFRVFINQFAFTITTGYGGTSYKNDPVGVYFYQDNASQFIFSNNIENVPADFSGFTRWLNDPQASPQVSRENISDLPFNPANNPVLQNQAILFDTDTAAIGFRGYANSIPISLSIHYNYEAFRVGLGYMYEKQWIPELRPTAFRGIIRNYQPNFSSTNYNRWYGLVGYQFYQFWNWSFVGEVQFGKANGAKKHFNKSVINRSLYTNIGISFENVWSEYFRLIVKPSIEFKSYTVNLPDGGAVKHRHPSFFFQVGVSINIPDIPRTPMKSDHTQLKHIYTDPASGRKMEVRGQPMTKIQNPKVGQNHQRPHRDHRKNKKKLNPSKSPGSANF